MSKRNIRNVLGLWYYQELLDSLGVSKSISDETSLLPWERNLEDSNLSCENYKILGGEFLCTAFDNLESLGKYDEPLDSIHSWDQDKRLPLYSLHVTAEGTYIPGSFNLWEITVLLIEIYKIKSEDIYFDNNIEVLNKQIDAELTAVKPRFSDRLIRNLNKSLGKILFNVNLDDFEYLNLLSYKILEGEDDNYSLNNKQSLLLKKAAESVDTNTLIGKYIDGLIDVSDAEINPASLDNPEVWDRNLQPYAYAKVAWPRKTQMNSSQEWISNSINLSKKSDIKYFAAAKKTQREIIVEDLIAQQVEKRATILNSLSKVSDAFTMWKFNSAPDSYSKNYYSPLNQLSESSLVLVADDKSELDLLCQRLNSASNLKQQYTMSGDFDIDKHKEVYFTNLAERYFKESVWGLGAVYIESKADLKRLLDTLVEELDNFEYWNSLKGTINEPSSFNRAKQEYREAVLALDNKFVEIQTIYERAMLFNKKLDESERLEKKLQDLKLELNLLEDEKFEKNVSLDKSVDQLRDRELEYAESKKSLGLFKNLLYRLFKLGDEAKLLAATQEKIEANKRETDEIRNSIGLLEAQISKLLSEKDEQDRLQNALQMEIETLEPQYEVDKEQFQKNYVDRKAYTNFNSSEFHAITPWVDNEFSLLRERLFKASLDLQRAFILQSNEIRQNLKRAQLMLDDKYDLEDVEFSWQTLFRSLQLIVPLFIFSKKSLEELLFYGKNAENGTFIFLDPETQKAKDLVSSLYLADRFIALGDPLIMPKMPNYSKSINLALGDYFELRTEYLSPDMSTTDYLLVHSEMLFEVGGRKIPFPLRMQYLMAEPLFSLYNELCLDNLLFGRPTVVETFDDKPKVLDSSSWPVIRTDLDSEQLFSQQNADVALKLIDDYIKNYDEIPDLGLAFFFRDVLEEWLRYSEDFFSKRAVNYSAVTLEDILSFLGKNSFLLVDWDGTVYTELIFIAGASLQCDGHSVELFDRSARSLYTLFNSVSKNLLILADPELWAESDRMHLLFKRMSELGFNHKLKQKELNFITVPDKLILVAEYNSFENGVSESEEDRVEIEKMLIEERKPKTSETAKFETIEDEMVKANVPSVVSSADSADEEFDRILRRTLNLESNEGSPTDPKTKQEKVRKKVKPVFVKIGKDETDYNLDDIVDIIDQAGLKFNPGLYYVADSPGMSLIIERAYEETDEDIIVERKDLNYTWIEENKAELNLPEVIFDLLEELDRFSKNSATVLVSKSWFSKYINDNIYELNANKFKYIDIDEIDEIGSTLVIRYYKLHDNWIVSSAKSFK